MTSTKEIRHGLYLVVSLFVLPILSMVIILSLYKWLNIGEGWRPSPFGFKLFVFITSGLPGTILLLIFKYPWPVRIVMIICNLPVAFILGLIAFVVFTCTTGPCDMP